MRRSTSCSTGKLDKLFPVGSMTGVKVDSFNDTLREKCFSVTVSVTLVVTVVAFVVAATSVSVPTPVPSVSASLGFATEEAVNRLCRSPETSRTF